MLTEAKDSLEQWEVNLSQVRDGFSLCNSSRVDSFLQLRLDRKSGDAALLSMTDNVASRLDVKTRKSWSSFLAHHVLCNFIPSVPDKITENILRQMAICQTAANEFLRQFWSCIYPRSTEFPTLSAPTPAQKATKAAKMIGYISKTREKVDALIRTAQLEGVDPTSVETVSVLCCKHLVVC